MAWSADGMQGRIVVSIDKALPLGGQTGYPATLGGRREARVNLHRLLARKLRLASSEGLAEVFRFVGQPELGTGQGRQNQRDQQAGCQVDQKKPQDFVHWASTVLVRDGLR